MGLVEQNPPPNSFVNYMKKLILFIFILLTLGSILTYLDVKIDKGIKYQLINKERTTGQIEVLEQAIEVYELKDKTTFTAYTLSVDETDENPCIGAGNNNLCELKKEMRICASRDLPLDTVIYIDGFGECVIKDRLNKRYKGTNRVDILMETKQEAIQFGKRQLKYIVL